MKPLFKLGSALLAAAALAGTAALVASPVQAAQKHFIAAKRPIARHALESATAAGTPSAVSTVPAQRIFGADRIETAIAASQDTYDNAGTVGGNLAKAVVLSRSDEYADALGGSALAGAATAPLLLTPSTTLDPKVKTEIDRVLGGTGTVFVLGGTGAISASVETALTQAGYTATRLAGVDRYDTSVAVATAVAGLVPGGKPQFVLATTGQNFPDGLAAGATAGGFNATVVLTRDSTLTASVKAYLDAATTNGIDTFAVGGQAAAVKRAWTDTLTGVDRFDTASTVAIYFWGNQTTPAAEVGLATGLDWPDALSGGAFMTGYGPLLLTRQDSLPPLTVYDAHVLVHSATPSTVQSGWVFGGPAVVSDSVLAAFETALNS